MHYYSRNLGDYAKKCGRLSMLEHGAYTLLMDACYDREQFPTLAEAIEWSWARTEVEIEAVKFVLSRFFELQDDRYVQKRISEELEVYHTTCSKNKAIATAREEFRRTGKRSVDKSSPVVHESSPVVHESSPVVHEPPPNHKPITNNHKPITKPNGLEAASAAPKAASVAKKSKAKGERRCPDGFAVTPELLAWAQGEGLTVSLDTETQKMRLYEFSKPRSDWVAVWKNWMLNAQTYANARPAASQSRYAPPARASPDSPPAESDFERKKRLEAEAIDPRIAKKMPANKPLNAWQEPLENIIEAEVKNARKLIE